MTQQRLWCHHYQRLPDIISYYKLFNLSYDRPKGQRNLSPENVEIVCRRGAVSHDHVDVGELLHVKLFLLRWEVFRIITDNIIINSFIVNYNDSLLTCTSVGTSLAWQSCAQAPFPPCRGGAASPAHSASPTCSAHWQ